MEAKKKAKHIFYLFNYEHIMIKNHQIFGHLIGCFRIFGMVLYLFRQLHGKRAIKKFKPFFSPFKTTTMKRMNVNYSLDANKNWGAKVQNKRACANYCYHRVYNRKTPEFRNKLKT